MTDLQSNVFPQDLQEISLDGIAAKFKEAIDDLHQAINHDPTTLLNDEPKPIEQVIESLNRQPRWQLIEIGEGLANVAALLHVAYKSAVFESDDYQDEIFSKSIGSGGDQVLLQRILDEVTVCYKKVSSLRLQLVDGEE